jgi:hypothetical protein
LKIDRKDKIYIQYIFIRKKERRKREAAVLWREGDCAAGFCSVLLVAYFSASFERCLLGRKSKNYTFAFL